MSSPTAISKSIAEHARDVLIETNNPGVMYGDCGLLDQIAKRSGHWRYTDKKRNKPNRPWGCVILNSWGSVLDGCERSPDLFKKCMYQLGRVRCRGFILKECIVDGEWKSPRGVGLSAKVNDGE